MEYSYNRDDTINWVKDARGVKTNFGYSWRHQITSISHDLSAVLPNQNVAATPSVTMQYDSAGNRSQMTDGLGTMTYHYDSLSRMDWEERNFTGVGVYRLTYGYNNAGLASITNPSSSVVSYTHDHTGTLTAVTGSGPVSAATYASGMQYRAFGALKSMSYGNTRQLSVTYDSRMRPTQWDLAGLLGSEYRYDYFHEHTGRVTFARNLYDVRPNPSPVNPATLDRSYEYDQVARLSWTNSGAEATAHAINGQWGTQNGPYAQAKSTTSLGTLWSVWVGARPILRSRPVMPTIVEMDSVTIWRAMTSDPAQTMTYDATGQQVTDNYSGFFLAGMAFTLITFAILRTVIQKNCCDNLRDSESTDIT